MSNSRRRPYVDIEKLHCRVGALEKLQSGVWPQPGGETRLRVRTKEEGIPQEIASFFSRKTDEGFGHAVSVFGTF
jgi:hypothetical protein